LNFLKIFGFFCFKFHKFSLVQGSGFERPDRVFKNKFGKQIRILIMAHNLIFALKTFQYFSNLPIKKCCSQLKTEKN